MKTYIKLPDDLAKDLEVFSRRYGLSKSGFIAYSLAKHINDLKYTDKAVDAVTGKLSTIMDDMSKEERSKDGFCLSEYPDDELPDDYI